MDGYLLCRFDEIPDPGARAVRVGSGDWPLRMVVVRQGARAFAYVNRCPHAGHPLDWQPGQFVLRDGPLLQCPSHGALFTLDAGHCVAGPCAGRRLTAIAVRVSAGNVLLCEDAAALIARHA